jgi:two-component system, sensor histidine kinase and response regulator
VALNGPGPGSSPVAAAPSRASGPSAAVAGPILLVENNKVNQLVGSKVLKSLCYRYDIANNGVDVVSAYEAGSYDAVLLDCQMPEMDGYGATGAIRRMEDDTDASCCTPSIAMAAVAMEGDREGCLAAGMQDFIIKRVRLETVSGVLARWVAQNVPAEGHELSVTGSGRVAP